MKKPFEQLPRFLSPEPLVTENSPLSKLLSDLQRELPIEKELLKGILVTLSKKESHHLLSVLRMKQGDSCEVLCPLSGKVFIGYLESVEQQLCKIRISDLRECLHQPRVNLIVGAPKFSTADLIVEKSVELGVRSVSFFNAERSARSLSEKEREKRLERMFRVRDAALKQSLSDTLSDLAYFPSLAQALEPLTAPSSKAETRLICLLRGQGGLEEVPTITTVFSNPRDSERFSDAPLEKSPKSDETYVLVGPEGGFERSEIDLALSCHFSAVSLGVTRLRTETACILAAGTALLAGSE